MHVPCFAISKYSNIVTWIKIWPSNNSSLLSEGIIKLDLVDFDCLLQSFIYIRHIQHIFKTPSFLPMPIYRYKDILTTFTSLANTFVTTSNALIIWVPLSSFFVAYLSSYQYIIYHIMGYHLEISRSKLHCEVYVLTLVTFLILFIQGSRRGA